MGWRSDRRLGLASVPRVKIAVCVKQVPDATVHKRLDPATNRLDRSGESALNATDVNAVEEALRLKDAHGGEVVVVSLGPEKAMDSLRKALAMGADRAVLVADAAAAGSDLVGTSYALATALEREAADLVLFGQASSDADGAVLWAAVAERLRRPMVSQVAELTVEGSSLTGKRQTEFGYDMISAPLPAVVAVSDAINEPRYPSLKGIMGAKSKPQEILSLADAGLDASRVGEPGSRTSVLAAAPPPPKSGQVRIEDDGSAAEKIVEYLAEKRLV
jgi:electron transfer flavoprotein beta subunit